MSAFSLAGTAVTNSLRSISRTLLTVVAIFIGAFTLTLTTAVGNGITTYIDNTTSSLGGGNTLTVSKTPDGGDGPARYQAGTTVTSNGDGGPGGGLVETLTGADLTEIRGMDKVSAVRPVLPVSPDYVVYDDGREFQLTAGGFTVGTTLQLVAGTQPDPDSKTRQIAIPESYVDPMEFTDAEDAIDKTVTIGITDADGKQSKVTAKVVAVTAPTLGSGDTASMNEALNKTLYDRQSVGLSKTAKERYAAATIELDEGSTAADVTTLQNTLVDEGFTGKTVDDQIGDFKTVIDAIVLVLNAFAVIALVAAGFGIVNTLLMSVTERTREIGLMKAMGLGGGSIFALFSFEAVFIGFLGSAIGAGAAVLVGTVANGVLAGGVLAGLPGLTVLAFAPVTVLGIVALVMGIAFLAGSIPALRAARQDPIESLRYE